MARKIANLVLAANDFKALERGQLLLNKGEKAMGVRLTLAFVLVGGASLAAPINAADLAENDVLLGGVTLRRFDYGRDGKYDAPFINFTLADLVDHMRRCYRIGPQAEFEDGANAIAAGETKTLLITYLLPTGKWAAFTGRDRNRWGAGRSQVSTFRMEFARDAVTLVTGADAAHGVSISGNLNIGFDLDTVDAKGDPWNPIPHVFRFTDTRDTVLFPRGGMPLAIDELTTPNTLSNITLLIDGQVVHDQVSPDDIARAAIVLTSEVGYFTDESVVDGRTKLYDTSVGGRHFSDYPTGTPRFRQNTRTQDAVDFLYTYVPLKSAEEINSVVSNAATLIRQKEVKAASEATLRGENIPPRLQPFAGFRLLDRDDAEFEQAPGLYARPNGAAPEVEAPAAQIKALRGQVAHLRDNGNKKAADALVDRAAAAVPGTVQSTRGFSAGDTAMREDRKAKLGLM